MGLRIPVVLSGKSQGVGHVVYGDGFIFDDASISAKAPAFLFVLDGLVLVVQFGPEGLLEFVLDGLVVFDVGDGPFSVNFGGIDEVD